MRHRLRGSYSNVKDTKRHETLKDTKRHEKTRKDKKITKRREKDIIKCGKTRYIENRLFYLALYIDHCCQLKSVARKKINQKWDSKLLTTTQMTKQNNVGHTVSIQSIEPNLNPNPKPPNPNSKDPNPNPKPPNPNSKDPNPNPKPPILILTQAQALTLNPNSNPNPQP